MHIGHNTLLKINYRDNSILTKTSINSLCYILIYINYYLLDTINNNMSELVIAYYNKF